MTLGVIFPISKSWISMTLKFLAHPGVTKYPVDLRFKPQASMPTLWFDALYNDIH